MRFLKKVEDKVRRFEEVRKNLEDPSISQDQAKLRDFGKEFRALEPVSRLYRAYLKAQSELEEAQKILADKTQSADIVALAGEELQSLETRKRKITHDLETLLIQDDPMLAKNVILEIRAGTGGLEAGLFAADLFRMYTKFAQSSGFKLEALSSSPNEAGGFKEIIASVTGPGAYGRFKYESGTHRVQRVPATEASGRIHTSAVTVAIMPEAEEVDVEIKTEDLRIDVFRSGGPGGQSVNTTDSAVRVTHVPSGLVVSCQDEKSQLKNKQKALKILRARLFDKMTSERNAQMARQRKEQVGSGDRSEKIRTYNFPDRRVTDHRVGLTIYNLENVMEGEIGEFVDALFEAEWEKG
ncbi:MAG: peptide chain release factor 1 [Candidatus Omnitrophica bacterium]|nr:peptide chain release factor 1 [Candidatus Omnitrophota bacterium]